MFWGLALLFARLLASSSTRIQAAGVCKCLKAQVPHVIPTPNADKINFSPALRTKINIIFILIPLSYIIRK